jgi:hypothetical protein
MPDTNDKNTEDFDDEDDDLEVVEEIEIPKVKLNKNGVARKPLSAEQKERNLENLAKAREKARLQKLALSSKSKTEQDVIRKDKAKKLAETKVQKAIERKRLDEEIEKFKNKPVDIKPVGRLKDKAKLPVKEEVVKEEVVEDKVESVKKPVKKPRKKVIIVEHSSSDDDDEHVIIKTRKKTRTPVVAPVAAPVAAPPAVVYMPPPPPPPPPLPPPMSDEDKKKKLAFEADQKRKNNLVNAIFR